MFDTSDSPFCGELPEHREELRSATLFNDPPNSATIGQDTYAYPDVQTAQDEVRKTRDQATRCAITTEVIGGVDYLIALVEAPAIEYCDQSEAFSWSAAR